MVISHSVETNIEEVSNGSIKSLSWCLFLAAYNVEGSSYYYHKDSNCSYRNPSDGSGRQPFVLDI